MTRTALPLALLALLLALLPSAVADEGARPDDAAWVEDCPPDMMCAAGGEDAPGALGPEGCIDCMAPPADAPEAQDDEAGARDVAAPSLLAAVGIVGVAALATTMLGRR